MLGIIVVILVFSLGSWGVNADAVVQGYDQTRRYAQDAKLLTSAVTEYKEIAQAEIDYQNKVEEQGFEYVYPIKSSSSDTLRISYDFLAYTLNDKLPKGYTWASSHSGVDTLVNGDTDTVVAVADGSVVSVAEGKDFNRVVINDNRGYTWQYLHMDKVFVKAGDAVTAGQELGSVGGIGSDGTVQYAPHLHLTVGPKGQGQGGYVNAFSLGTYSTSGASIQAYNTGDITTSGAYAYSAQKYGGIDANSTEGRLPVYMYASNFTDCPEFKWTMGLDKTVYLTYKDGVYQHSLPDDSPFWGRYYNSDHKTVIAGPFIPSKETE